MKPSTYQIISREEADEILDSAGALYEPIGRYVVEETVGGETVWTAIDNMTGEAWTEEFETRKSAVLWLNGHAAFDRYGVRHPARDISTSPTFGPAIVVQPPICPRCHRNPIAPHRHRCLDCLSDYRDIMRNFREKNEHHWDDNDRAKDKKRYHERRASNICVGCGKPATCGVFCLECYVRTRKRNAKTDAKRREERRKRGLIPEYRIKNNLCCFCGTPLPEESLRKRSRACPECAAYHRELIVKGTGDKKHPWRLKNEIMFEEFRMKKRG